MRRTKLLYEGVVFELPYFLAYCWPHHLSIQDFPTYCGAGEGFGDKLVPDRIWMQNVSPACFIHDIDFLVASGTWTDFQKCNNRFLRNLRSIIKVKTHMHLRLPSYLRAMLYWVTVSSPLGWSNYAPVMYDPRSPLTHPVIKDKIDRLNRGKNV
jgi:hypothetical protein